MSLGACCAWGDKAAGIRDANLASISRLSAALCAEEAIRYSPFIRFRLT
jgi:hypothetical protein